MRMPSRTEGETRDQGFTLIELLVVMIIIGILAAIAVPVFLNQRAKAQDTATKADVTTIGKEVATYFVDQSAAPTVALDGTTKQYKVNGVVVGRVSSGTISLVGANFNATDAANKWCVELSNTAGSQKNWKYSAGGGLQAGTCTANTDY